MLSSTVIIDVLKKEDVCFYSGVPDSLLKEFCMELDKPDNGINHIIAANEGCAVGMAIGNYLVTGKIPVVYLQNSGIGNITNPVCSLSAEEVFRIPLLFIIGWRGEIDQNGIQLADEPQHRMQGETTLSLLESLRIPYSILTPEMEDENAEEIISELITLLRHSLTPVALVVRKNTFKKLKNNKVLPYISAFKEHMSREHALEECVTRIPYGTPVVCTTGMLSRELFEIREKNGVSHNYDFLNIGGMGLASQIAYGISVAYPNGKVICLDGDGACLMHMGGLTNSADASNLIHIIFNNGAHDSVGGQKTKGAQQSFSAIAAACGYTDVSRVSTPDELRSSLVQALNGTGSSFIEILCCTGSRADLCRPFISPLDNKKDFMQSLNNSGE